MSSQFTFTVRFSTGHTVTVRVSPNDPVSRIVEEACAKRKGKYDPMGFTVKKQGPAGRLLPLDMSLTVRHANLPNRYAVAPAVHILLSRRLFYVTDLSRATLELEEAEAAATNAVVMLCLQSESGKRWQEELSAETTLWEAVERSGFEKEASDKPESDDAAVPVIVYMTREVVGEDSLKETTLRRLGLVGGRALVRLSYRNPDVFKDQAMSGQITMRRKPDNESASARNSPPRRAMRVDDGRSYLQRVMDERKSDAQKDAHEPEEEEGGNSKKEPERVEETDLPPPLPTTNTLSAPMNQAETRPPRREEEDDDNADVDEEDPVLNYIGENDAVVYAPEDVPKHKGLLSTLTPSSEVSDSFFDLSEAEVRKLYQEKVRAVKEAEEGGELTTAAMKEARREARKLKILQTYRKTVVRVQLPGRDRAVLQATFLSGQTIGDVAKFLRQFLADPRTDFELFVAPPRTVLADEETLLDAGCVPSANLHFSLKNREVGTRKVVYYFESIFCSLYKRFT